MVFHVIQIQHLHSIGMSQSGFWQAVCSYHIKFCLNAVGLSISSTVVLLIIMCSHNTIYLIYIQWEYFPLHFLICSKYMCDERLTKCIASMLTNAPGTYSTYLDLVLQSLPILDWINLLALHIGRLQFNFGYVQAMLDVHREENAKLFANSGDPDQNAASDLGPYWLQITLLGAPDKHGLRTNINCEQCGRLPCRKITTSIAKW